MKKLLNSLGVVALAGFLSACAQQPKLSLSEQEALRESRIAAASQFYEGKSQAEIFSAIEELFLYLDEDDFAYEMVGDNRLVASHYYFIYAVLSVGNKYIWFDIVTDESAEGTNVSLIIESQGSGGLTMATRETFKYNMRHSGNVPADGLALYPGGIDDYEAFHGMLNCFVYGQGWYEDFDLPYDQWKDRSRSLAYMEGLEDKPPAQCKAG